MDNNIVISGKKNQYLKKILIHFFISAIIGWFIALFGEIVDSVTAGLFIGNEALAGVEIIIPWYSLIVFSGDLLALGTGIKYSHCIGKGDVNKANKIFTESLFASIVLGVIVSIIMLVAKTPFLSLYKEYDQKVLEYASRYYDPYIILAAFYPLFLVLYQTIDVDGDFKVILVCDVTQPIINLGLSLILVTSVMKGDVLALGIATIVSYGFEFLIMFIHFFKKSNNIRIKPYFSFKDLGNTILLCTSSWLNILFVAVLDFIMNFAIGKRFGSESAGYINVYSIINFTINFAQIFASAGGSASLLWSISKGEENNIEMLNTTKIIRKISYIMIIAVTILFASFCWFWPLLYGVKEDPYYNYALIASLLICFSNMFFGLTNLITYYYLSMDKIAPSIINSLFSMLLIPLIIGIPLSFPLGIYGYITGFVMAPIISWLMLLVYIYRRYGKDNFPYYLPKVEEEQYCYNLLFDKESIIKLNDQTNILLDEHRINDSLKNKILLTIEESLMMIKERNFDYNNKKNKKEKVVSGELFICFNKDEIRVIEKDDGLIFNLSDKDQNILDLRTYVFLQNLTNIKSSKNTITVATNTNSFVFNK